MRSRIFLVIGAIIILVAVASAVFYVSEQSHEVSITIKTNGTDSTVQTSSLIFIPVPNEMLAEMRDKVEIDVKSDTSTVNSVKADMQAIAVEYNYTAEEVKIDSQFGVDQLPMPATVSGTSMVPTLKDGQSIMVLKTTDFKVGDIVVARHPTYNLIVKRVAEINDGQVYLKSDNREVIVTGNTILKGLDTWLPKENVIGVVKVY